MAQGKKVSVYIDNQAMQSYEKLVEIYEKLGKSASYAISRAIEEKCKQELLQLNLSEGAYAVMVDGDFDELSYVKIPDGGHYKNVVTCSEEAYKSSPAVADRVNMMRALGR